MGARAGARIDATVSTGCPPPTAVRASCAHNAAPPAPPQWDVEQRVQSIVDETLKDISQKYRIQEELGAGAQATVYKALHKKTGKKVRPRPSRSLPRPAAAAAAGRGRG